MRPGPDSTIYHSSEIKDRRGYAKQSGHINTVSETLLIKGAKSNTDKGKETLTYFQKAEWTCEIPSPHSGLNRTCVRGGDYSSGYAHLPSGFKWPIKFYLGLATATAPITSSYMHFMQDKTRLWVVSTQCNVQKTFYGIVHLKPGDSPMPPPP